MVSASLDRPCEQRSTSLPNDAETMTEAKNPLTNCLTLTLLLANQCEEKGTEEARA